MELEKQVCSLELAKKLKEIRVRQESYFRWCFHHITSYNLVGRDWHLESRLCTDTHVQGKDTIAAFTVAELLDMCPAATSILKRTDIETKTIPRYYVETWDHYRNSDFDSNPANALAGLLIYLIENKLIDLVK